MKQNTELDLAWQFIESTGTHLFLTGKAGTGKTTFLQNLKKESPKRMIILAPTGIAAIHAGGTTIHSFFQLPFAPYVPESSFSSNNGTPQYRFRFSKEKLNIIRSIDLLVIDEISMVRADLLDSIDAILRRFRDRGKPFGGVQLLMIGDLQQLAPVVKEEEWQILSKYYETPFFFSSQALQQTEYCTIELKTVYRQKDRTFLELLNRIRENSCDEKVLSTLNQRYIPSFAPSKEEGYIRLVTHNYQAQQINDYELKCLPGNSYTFQASIEGKFPEYSYPTDEVLELKQGAQIMFVKNDTSGEHRFFNGMIGEVTSLSSTSIEVRSKETNQIFSLQEEEWTNAKYVLNEETKEIIEDIEGVFRQYPIKLAWAITIHKSQGLTFDRAIIDASASFAHGQTYVALSRCRTLEGLVLSAPLSSRAIITDHAIDRFTVEARKNEPNETRFRSLQQAYFLELLSNLFDFDLLDQTLKHYIRLVDEHLYKLFPNQLILYKEGMEQFYEKIIKVAQKFNIQYTRLIDSALDYTLDSTLQERIHSGAVYFNTQLQPLNSVLIQIPPLETDNRELKKKLKDAHDELRKCFFLKENLLSYIIQNGFHTNEYLRQKAIYSIEDPKKTIAGKEESHRKSRSKKVERDTQEKKDTESIISSDILHPDLYNQLITWRNAEASRLSLPVYTVIQQKAILGISNILPSDKAMLLQIPYFGKKGAEKYGDIILEMVKEYRKKVGLADPEIF